MEFNTITHISGEELKLLPWEFVLENIHVCAGEARTLYISDTTREQSIAIDKKHLPDFIRLLQQLI